MISTRSGRAAPLTAAALMAPLFLALSPVTALPGVRLPAQVVCPALGNPATARGWEAYRSDEIEAAETAFRDAIEACPAHVGARTGLGFVLLRQGDEPAARALFQEVVADAPGTVDAREGLGVAAWRRGDLDAVSRWFSELLELVPGHPTAVDYLARLPEGIGPPPERPPLVLPDTAVYPSRVAGDRFEIRTDRGWEPFYIKGVNLGAALPGRHPSQFPDSATYVEWIQGMADLGANTVRVYTIHPPHFYGALAEYNRAHPEAPLWLVHGVWTELPPGSDFSAAAFEDEFFGEMRRVVDLIHGRADIRPRPGHASGFYTADVSEWTLAWIIGREWEPHSVVAFESLRPDLDGFRGKYVRVHGGHAMDAWLAEAVEYMIAYEMVAYREQRPIAYTSWPTLDPLVHPSESTIDEEMAIRASLGEPVTISGDELNDNEDEIGLDATLFEPTAAFPAGVFASFHAYPYYPDFMVNEKAYLEARSSFGPSNYFGYLTELKAHHEGMPVVIAEYGLPASIGNAHMQPQGWHHGGVTEAEMAEADRRMTLEIAEAGLAGGMIFAWMDEWFKKNWIVYDFEIPLERNRLWFNRLDAEQHYGMVAIEPELPVPGGTFQERLEGWREVPALYESADGRALRATSDEAYLWLLYEEGDAGPADEIFLGFDTVDPVRGDLRWPGLVGGASPVGMEFVLRVDDGGAHLLADPSQNQYRREAFGLGPIRDSLFVPITDPMPGLFRSRQEQRYNPPWVTVPNADGVYDSLRVIVNRRRFTRDSTEIVAIGYDRGVLPRGPLPDGLWERTDGALEVRIPWLLLNVTDPSARRVLQGAPEPSGTFGTVLVDGIRITSTARTGSRWRAWPEGSGPVATFTWPTWEEPTWRARRRPVFDVLRETYDRVDYADITTDPVGGGDVLLPDPIDPPVFTGGGGPSADDPPSRAERFPRQTLEDRAAVAWNQGLDEQAEELYRRLIETRPDHVLALHRLGLLAARDERFQEALGYLERLVEIAPDNLEGRIDRARVRAWSGDHDRAIAELDAVLEESPNHPRALDVRAALQAAGPEPTPEQTLEDRAAVAWNQGLDEQAEELYRRVLEARPDHVLALHRLGLLTARDERFDESLAFFDRLLQVAPGNLEARVDRARVTAWNGDFDGAIAELDAVLRQSPGHPRALDVREALQATGPEPTPEQTLEDRAAAAWTAGRDTEAEELYRRLLEARPDHVLALHRLGLLAARDERFDESLGYLERLVQIAPDNIEARIDRARVRAWNGEYDRAIAELDAVLRENPQHPRAFEVRTVLQAAAPPEPTAQEALEEQAATAWTEGRTEEAEELYRRLLEDRPNEGVALHRIALAAAWDERFEESLTFFDRLVGVAPANVEVRIDRARVRAWSGDYDRAIAELDAVLEEDPGNLGALEERARFQAWAGRYEASLASYDRLMGITPSDPALQTERARVLSWQGDLEAARAAYAELLEENPNDLEVRLGLARILTFAGETEEALVTYRGVLETDPGNLEALQGIARALSWGGRLIQGEEAWRDAVAADPENVDSRVGLAAVLRWQGRPAAALQQLEIAEQVDPNNPDLTEQLRWVRASLAPRVSIGVSGEDDSDGNRMVSTTFSVSVHPHPRLGVRADLYRRDVEQGALENQPVGGTLTLSWLAEPGWNFSAGVGGSETDSGSDSDSGITAWSAGLSSPGRYPVGFGLSVSQQALDATALLAERSVTVEQAGLNARWSPGSRWTVSGNGGLARFTGQQENDRWNGSLRIDRRLGNVWTLGLSGRAFGFDDDLDDGYFDPDFYGLAELTGRWLYEPNPMSFSLEVAPGYQQVGEDGDVESTIRASGRITWRVRPGREITLGAGWSETGLQSFATGDAAYRYTALLLQASWVF